MRLVKEQSVCLLIDMQEKLFPHMAERDRLVNRISTLLQGLRLLGTEIIVTQQYSKGLGETIPQVSSIIHEFSFIEKISFSCCDEPLFAEKIDISEKKFIIIAGIEAHVCVLQTTLDLLERNFVPVVVEDCVSSRDRSDKQIAIERMRCSGAIITSCESLLFELTRFAGSEVFKSISRLVK